MKFFEEISIGSKFDAKGFKQAETALGRLSGSAAKLAKGFGLAFGAAAVARFAKQSVKAFAEDEKASVKLLKAVDNLGMGFEQTRITNFISELEKTAMVADDLLRPAFQSLLTTTGSVSRSQDLLKLALDVSAGSGEDLVSVANDLSAAYVGQTKGLTKYKTGLTKAELSTMGFAAIQEKLNSQYSGQNAARLDTYQGKIDTLNIAYGNMQETIGKGLLDSFEVLAGDAGIGGASSAMADFADFTSNAIYGLANLLSVKVPSGKTSLFGLLLAPIKDSLVAGPLGALSRLGARAQEAKRLATPIATNASGTPLTIAKSNSDLLRENLEKEAAARAKALAAMQMKSLKAQQDTLKLSKAKAIFDLKKIQIEAALKGKISEEDRVRLLLMQAIEAENITQIEKYTTLLDEAQKKTIELRDVLKGDGPFTSWLDGINQVLAGMFSIGTQIQANGREWSSYANMVATTVIQSNGKEFSSSFSPSATLPVSGNTNSTGAVNVTVNAGVGDPEAIARVIEDTLRQSAYRGTGSRQLDLA